MGVYANMSANMKATIKKVYQRIKTTSAWVGVGVCVMLLSSVLYADITQIVGIAVSNNATHTAWNNVRDAGGLGDGISGNLAGVGLFGYNGATWDRLRETGGSLNVNVTGGGGAGGNQTPADGFANPTDFQGSWSLMGIFNGTTWDRLREPLSDTQAATGLLGAGEMIYDGTQWTRLRTVGGDDRGTAGLLGVGLSGFDGAQWDRIRTVSNLNNVATTSSGAVYTAQLATWSVVNTQAGAVQATASKAAGGGTVRHVATDLTVCFGDTAVAAPRLAHLRDGATGAGTILRSFILGVPVANDTKCENVNGINITGSANTAMTIEFAAAGSATATATVSLSGYSTP